jgi:hypothetical protein
MKMSTKLEGLIDLKEYEDDVKHINKQIKKVTSKLQEQLKDAKELVKAKKAINKKVVKEAVNNKDIHYLQRLDLWGNTNVPDGDWIIDNEPLRDYIDGNRHANYSVIDEISEFASYVYEDINFKIGEEDAASVLYNLYTKDNFEEYEKVLNECKTCGIKKIEDQFKNEEYKFKEIVEKAIKENVDNFKWDW